MVVFALTYPGTQRGEDISLKSFPSSKRLINCSFSDVGSCQIFLRSFESLIIVGDATENGRMLDLNTYKLIFILSIYQTILNFSLMLNLKTIPSMSI